MKCVAVQGLRSYTFESGIVAMKLMKVLESEPELMRMFLKE